MLPLEHSPDVEQVRALLREMAQRTGSVIAGELLALEAQQMARRFVKVYPREYRAILEAEAAAAVAGDGDQVDEAVKVAPATTTKDIEDSVAAATNTKKQPRLDKMR